MDLKSDTKRAIWEALAKKTSYDLARKEAEQLILRDSGLRKGMVIEHRYLGHRYTIAGLSAGSLTGPSVDLRCYRTYKEGKRAGRQAQSMTHISWCPAYFIVEE